MICMRNSHQKKEKFGLLPTNKKGVIVTDQITITRQQFEEAVEKAMKETERMSKDPLVKRILTHLVDDFTDILKADLFKESEDK